MLVAILVVAVFFLAWANGANDNFKGVATLYGSQTASFRRARLWTAVTTLAGSLCSVVLADRLLSAFRGKGLVGEAFLGPELLAAVAVSGALTIGAATRIGIPTSTTHALTGALVGAGLAAAGAAGVGWQQLTTKFAQPLLLSPVLSIGLAAGLYILFRSIRRRLKLTKETCVCVGEGEMVPASGLSFASAVSEPAGVSVAAPGGSLHVEIGETEQCVERYSGRVLGLSAQGLVDTLHYLSAGAVCFARAVNDTPKIAALLFGLTLFGSSVTRPGLVVVALAMTAGGWLHSRKVADTMAKNITELNGGQGLSANLMTAFLVLGASRMGVPVSTTHVSCGAIFGIGLVNGKRDWATIRTIAAVWVTTLPLAFLLGFAVFSLLA